MSLLTIGMPHFKDPDSVWFTIQHLAMFHNVKDINLVFVEDAAGSPEAKSVEEYIKGYAHNHFASVKYVANPTSLGPARSKNLVFENSETKWTLCMDCHILLPPGTIKDLVDYLEEFPNSEDLLTGPILYNDLIPAHMDTHLEPIFRGQMWGTWAGDERGRFGTTPFSIWGMGHGLMVAQTKTWKEVGGFHPESLGFGGEEGCLDENWRMHGHQVLCLPFLRWNHKFMRATGVPYVLSRYQKVRNYVLEFNRMGKNLTPIYNHFVSLKHPGVTIQEHLEREHSVDPQTWADKTVTDDMLEELHKLHKITTDEWDYLLADPSKHIVSPLQISLPPNSRALTKIADDLQHQPLDLDKHMPKITELSSGLKHVTEITRRTQSSAAILAAHPTFTDSYIYGPEGSPEVIREMFAVAQAEGVLWRLNTNPEYQEFDIAETDLLFFKCPHNFHDLKASLTRWSTKTPRILIHDTITHSEIWADGDGGIGLAQPCLSFLQENPDWFIAYHSNEQHGLTLLSRDPVDLPANKITVWPPGHGPGTQLKVILGLLGVDSESPGCDCNAKRNQMDIWGVEGCKEHKEVIVQWMREGASRWGWSSKLPTTSNISNLLDKFKAAYRSLTTGLIFTFNPIDPWPGLIDEAIRLAEAEENLHTRSRVEPIVMVPHEKPFLKD